MDTSAALPAVLITILLVLLNGFFVAAEYSFIRVRETQLDELGERGNAAAKRARKMSGQLDSYIGAAQLGVTLASLAIGWIGEPAVAALLAPAFGWLRDAAEGLYHVLTFAIAFAIITYLHIVIGELAPKYLAIQRALRIALLCAYPLDVFYNVVRPFNWLVSRSANAVVRSLGIRPHAALDAHSDEELKMLVA